MSRLGRAVLEALAGVAVFALAVWGLYQVRYPEVPRVPAALNGYYGSPAPQLTLEVSSCGGRSAVVELLETTSEIRVRVEHDLPPEVGPACATLLTQPLISPVGERPVLDAVTGDRARRLDR